MSATEPDLQEAVYTDDTLVDLGDDFGANDDLTDLGDEPKKAPEKTPALHLRREPVADLITFIWGGVGMALAQSQADIPVGRVMQFQAPLAGKKFDALIAGTWLDALLQPLAKSAEKIEGLGAVIMFPLLVGAYERNTALEPVVAPILRQIVRSTLVDMAPVLRKQAADAKRAAATVSDLNDIFDIPDGADPVDTILSTIFAPVQPQEEPEA